jgi:hypothetical protein
MLAAKWRGTAQDPAGISAAARTGVGAPTNRASGAVFSSDAGGREAGLCQAVT